jgi:hypothetical protein
MSTLWFCTREVVSSNLSMTILLFFVNIAEKVARSVKILLIRNEKVSRLKGKKVMPRKTLFDRWQTAKSRIFFVKISFSPILVLIRPKNR